MIIDFHVHILEPYVWEATRAKNVFTGFGTREPPNFGRGPVFREMTEIDRQIERMDHAGIDLSVLSAATVLQSSAWADAATDLDLCRRTNDFIHGWCQKRPLRFAGSAVLPLQDMDAALAELRRCVEELGMRVVQLPTHVGGHYLGEPELRPLWHAMHAQGLVAFIHPEGVKDLWFQKYRMWNSVGQPIEEAKCIASMIYEGLLEDLPDVKIVLAHGGGMLPYNMARMDRNVQHMPETMQNITHKPSDYLKYFYYDTCLYDSVVADTLVSRVGVDRILMGSDFPVGEQDVIGFVDKISGITPPQAARIKGGLAAELLGLAA